MRFMAQSRGPRKRESPGFAYASYGSYHENSMLWRVMADIVVAVHAAYVAIVVVGFAAILIGSASAVAMGAELLLPCRAPGDDSAGMRRGTCRNQLPAHEAGERASAKRRRDRLRARFYRLLDRLADLL